MKRSLFVFLVPLCAAASGCFVPEDDLPHDYPSFLASFPGTEGGELHGREELTLELALETAWKNNPDLAAARRAVERAKYRYYASLSGYLPQVSWRTEIGQSLAETRDRRNPPADVLRRENVFGTANGLNVSLLVFDGFEREFNALAARENIRKADDVAHDVRRLLSRAAAYAFCDAALAAENIRIHTADREFQEASLAQAQIRYAEGDVPLDAVLNFRIRKAEAEAACLQASYECRAARYALSALLGCAEDCLPARFRVKTDVSSVYDSALLGDLIWEAVRRRPDLSAAVRSVRIARLERNAAWSAFLPEIKVFANPGFSTHAARTGGTPAGRYYYNEARMEYGLSCVWDLFNGFSSVQLIRERTVNESIRREELKARFLAVAEEVRTAYAACRNAADQARLFAEMRLLAARQRDLVAAEYWAGRETITRLNGAESSLVSAEARSVQSILSYRKAEAALAAAVGDDGESVRDGGGAP